MVGIQQPKIPAQLQEKNGPGPRRRCPPVLSISGGCYPVVVIHSCWVLPTRSVSPSRHVLPLPFPFLQTHGHFFFLISILKKSPPPSERTDPLPADRPVRLESEAAAGPSPAGTVSLSVYTFLRAIAPRKLSEPGTRPGAVLVTLKFLLQFCQI